MTNDTQLSTMVAEQVEQAHAEGSGSHRHYNFFEAKVHQMTKLCNRKSILTVNGQFPGPTIDARKANVVFVNVYNQCDKNITIHWHGVYHLARSKLRRLRPRHRARRDRHPPAARRRLSLREASQGGAHHPRRVVERRRPADDGRRPPERRRFRLSRRRTPTPSTASPGTSSRAPTTAARSGWPSSTAGRAWSASSTRGSPTSSSSASPGTASPWSIGTDAACTKPFTVDHIFIAPGQTVTAAPGRRRGARTPEHRFCMVAWPLPSPLARTDNSTTTAVLKYADATPAGIASWAAPDFPTLPALNESAVAEAYAAQLRPLASDEHMLVTK
ncbi:hypothetical protein ACP4OV_000932 [Aristida adscensionis]